MFKILMTALVLAAMQEPSASDVVSVTLPNHSRKITKDQFLDYEHNFFKYPTFRSFENDNRFYTNLYIIKGILVSFYDLNIPADDTRTIAQIQQQIMDRLSKKPKITVNYSRIVTVNNIQFLEFEFQIADELYMRFISDKSNNKVITGLLHYKQPNEENAQNVVNDMLASMHFKSQP